MSTTGPVWGSTVYSVLRKSFPLSVNSEAARRRQLSLPVRFIGVAIRIQLSSLSV